MCAYPSDDTGEYVGEVKDQGHIDAFTHALPTDDKMTSRRDHEYAFVLEYSREWAMRGRQVVGWHLMGLCYASLMGAKPETRS